MKMKAMKILSTIRKARGLVRGKSVKGMKGMMLMKKAGAMKGQFKAARYNYYVRTVGGKSMDAGLLDMCHNAVKGHGDGRISLADVDHILYTIKHNEQAHYSPVEKRTMQYVRSNHKKYPFTKAADKKFRAAIAKWGAQKGAKTRAMKAMKAMK